MRNGPRTVDGYRGVEQTVCVHAGEQSRQAGKVLSNLRWWFKGFAQECIAVDQLINAIDYWVKLAA